MNKNLLLFPLLALALGWTLAGSQKPPSQRSLLIQEMGRDPHFLRECLDNVAHQYTPGYRAYALLSQLQDRRTRLRREQGEMLQTQSLFHIAVMGQGFFSLQGGLYTRDGRLQLKGDKLVAPGGQALLGFPLNPQGQINGELTEVSLQGYSHQNFRIDPRGILQAFKIQKSGYESVSIFQLALVQFPREEFLIPQSPALLGASAAAGAAEPAGNVRVVQGFLEVSNADRQEQVAVLKALQTFAGMSDERVPIPEKSLQEELREMTPAESPSPIPTATPDPFINFPGLDPYPCGKVK